VRVLVVGSCGKKKLHNNLNQPNCIDIDRVPDINYWKQKFASICAPARDMYIGPQSIELVRAVDMLRTIPDVDVQLVILSAGFGVLAEEEMVPPYDCSFTNMKMVEVKKRSEELELQSSFTSLVNSSFDLVYLALGKQYLAALGTAALTTIRTPTIVFHGQDSDHLIQVPCSTKTVKAFSECGHTIHGVVGFKGDLLRILAGYALKKSHPYSEVKKWTESSHLRMVLHRLSCPKSLR